MYTAIVYAQFNNNNRFVSTKTLTRIGFVKKRAELVTYRASSKEYIPSMFMIKVFRKKTV